MRKKKHMTNHTQLNCNVFTILTKTPVTKVKTTVKVSRPQANAFVTFFSKKNNLRSFTKDLNLKLYSTFHQACCFLLRTDLKGKNVPFLPRVSVQGRISPQPQR